MSSNDPSSNRINIPEAKQGTEQFKMLTRQRGRRQPEERRGRRPDLPRGRMVKKMCPVGRAKYERKRRTAVGHVQRVEYIAGMTI